MIVARNQDMALVVDAVVVTLCIDAEEASLHIDIRPADAIGRMVLE